MYFKITAFRNLLKSERFYNNMDYSLRESYGCTLFLLLLLLNVNRCLTVTPVFKFYSIVSKSSRCSHKSPIMEFFLVTGKLPQNTEHFNDSAHLLTNSEWLFVIHYFQFLSPHFNFIGFVVSNGMIVWVGQVVNMSHMG